MAYIMLKSALGYLEWLLLQVVGSLHFWIQWQLTTFWWVI